MNLRKPFAFAAVSLLVLAAGAPAQDAWQNLFDGRTFTGWHSTATPLPANATPGQFGKSQPCASAPAPSAAMPADASHWEFVDGAVVACGDPAGYLVSDRSYKNFVLSLEFKTGANTNSGVFVRNGYEIQIWKAQPAGSTPSSAAVWR